VTPEQRVEEQLARARRGYRLARTRPEVRETALAWLSTHPSGMPDVDACWVDALTTLETPLARFLATDGTSAEWGEPLPLRCIVSSHPFPDLWRWTVPL
jgi:hypothetical protein